MVLDCLPNHFYLTSYNLPRVLENIYRLYSTTIRNLFYQYPDLSTIFLPQAVMSPSLMVGILVAKLVSLLGRCLRRIPFAHVLMLP